MTRAFPSTRALEALRQSGDRPGVARCILQQAGILHWGSETSVRKKRDLYAQALAAYKALGDEAGISTTLLNLAEFEFQDGHPEEAVRSIEQLLESGTRREANAFDLAISHNNSAAYRISLGDIDEGCALALQGLSFAR